MDLIYWLIENVQNLCFDGVIETAASFGHLSLIKLMRSMGAPCSSGAIESAAKHSHPKVLKYLFNSGIPCPKNIIDDCSDLEIVEFLLDKGERFSRRGLQRSRGDLRVILEANLHLLEEERRKP